MENRSVKVVVQSGLFLLVQSGVLGFVDPIEQPSSEELPESIPCEVELHE